MSEPAREQRAAAVRRAARGVAWVAGIYSAILCVLMIANFVQLTAVAPLDSPALTRLTEALRADPGNETLREEIRALDLLARKAYFTSRWQLYTGGWMLLAGLAVFLISLKLAGGARVSLPAGGDTADGSRAWLAAGRARRWITVGAGVLLVATLATGWLTHQQMAENDLTAAGGGGVDHEEMLASWPAFRGPGSNGVAAVESAPTSWDGAAGTGVVWKVEVPLAGYSSPVVWKNRIYLTGADRGKREVFAFAAESGELLWRHPVIDVKGSPEKMPRVHGDTGLAPSTVAVDGRHVFAIFPTGDLVGLDLDGNRVWSRNLGVPDNHYGHSSSLITHENLLIVQYDQSTDARLLGLSVDTGEDVWRVQRGPISWSSPIVVDTGGQWQLILTNSTSVDSYDPATGVKLWGSECLGGEMGPSAAYADGMVFAANDYAVAAGLRISEQGAEVAWTYEDYLPDTASPVATAEHVFLATSFGTVVCLDAKTGDQLWQHDYDMGFYASPVLVGDLVYALDLDGIMRIFRAAGSFESVAEPELGEPSACTPAFVGDRIYMRGESHLYCISGDA